MSSSRQIRFRLGATLLNMANIVTLAFLFFPETLGIQKEQDDATKGLLGISYPRLALVNVAGNASVALFNLALILVEPVSFNCKSKFVLSEPVRACVLILGAYGAFKFSLSLPNLAPIGCAISTLYSMFACLITGSLQNDIYRAKNAATMHQPAPAPKTSPAGDDDHSYVQLSAYDGRSYVVPTRPWS